MEFLLFIALTLFNPLDWPAHHQIHEGCVYSDQAALTRAWVSDGGDPAKVPVVDWKKDMVVAAYGGQKPTTGHAIKIDTVAIEGGENKAWDLFVIYQETQPGGAAGEILTYPSHVTRVSRVNTTGKVHFLKKDSPEARKILGNLRK